MLTVLKSFLKHDHKHVLRLSRLFSMETRLISCRLYIFCHLDISVESIERFICRQDQSNEEPLFIRPQFGSQFGTLHLLGFINPIRPGLFSRSPGPGGGLRGPDAKNQG